MQPAKDKSPVNNPNSDEKNKTGEVTPDTLTKPSGTGEKGLNTPGGAGGQLNTGETHEGR